MSTLPQSPFLVIRRGLAFWLHSGDPEQGEATLQAFREGCFEEVLCVDGGGGVWPLTGARLALEPTILHRLLPWRRLPVVLRYGARRSIPLDEVKSHLVAVLEGDNEFVDWRPDQTAQLLERVGRAVSISELIRIAGAS